MLRDTYKAFIICGQEITPAVIAGSLEAIGALIGSGGSESIITVHTMAGELFLVGLSGVFLYCEDNDFLDKQLIPYLQSKERV